MFFKSISPIVEFLNLKITVKQQKEKLKVNLFFDIKDGADEINLTPISIIATPEDLDEQLVEAIQTHLKALPSIAERVNLLLTSMKEVEKKTTAKAGGKKTTTTKSKAAPKKETAKAKEEPKADLFAEPVKKEEPKKKVVKKETPVIETKKEEPILDDFDLDLPGMNSSETETSGVLDLDNDEDDDLPI